MARSVCKQKKINDSFRVFIGLGIYNFVRGERGRRCYLGAWDTKPGFRIASGPPFVFNAPPQQPAAQRHTVDQSIQ